MSNEHEALSRYNHLAVPMKHCIIVFGGTWVYSQPYSISTIWLHNLYTEVWEKHSVSIEKLTEELENTDYDVKYTFSPASHSDCAAAVGADMFLFGWMGHRGACGILTNPLLKLSRNHQGQFSWSCIRYQSRIKSDKNAYQTGWGYLWIFGGKAVSVDDYLNENGGFSLAISRYNNQLLCFDPSYEKWTNPQCSGNVPEPRAGHSSAVLRDTVWLIGGFNDTNSLDNLCFNDLFQLDMHSLVWTKMQIIEPKPSVVKFVSLTAISDRQLLLLGNSIGDRKKIVNEGWIFDTLSASWRKHTTALKDKRPRHCHTATPSMNGTVMIIGGHGPARSKSRNPLETLHVMLQPKSLQHIAGKTISKYKAESLWKATPKSLCNLLGFL